MKISKFFIFAIAAIMCLSANAQYRHGLPANEKQPKPTVLNVGRPYSFSALKVYDNIDMKIEVYYDAKTRREYNKNLATGQITLSVYEKVDGKDMTTVYVIDHNTKTIRVQMQLPGTIADTRPSQRVEVWQGRWCDVSDDAKWYTDMETGIVLYEKCDYVKTIDIKLGEQDAALFQLPEGYKTEVSATKDLFDMIQQKQQQGKALDMNDMQELLKQKQKANSKTNKK